MKAASLQDTRAEVRKIMADSDELLSLYGSAERMVFSLRPRAKLPFAGNDVVKKVLISLYQGNRKWDRKKYPELKDFVFERLLLSEARNMLDHERKLVREGDGGSRNGDCNEERDESGVANIEELDGAAYSPDYEGEVDRRMMIDEAEKELESDEEKFFVFQGMIEEKSAEEIADANGYSVDAVRNKERSVKRTLDRRFKELRASLNDPRKFRKLSKGTVEESDSEVSV